LGQEELDMVRLANVMVLLVTIGMCLVCMELVVRLIDGYELTMPRLALSASPAAVAPADITLAPTDPNDISDEARKYVAALPIAAGVDRSWFDLSPPAYASQRSEPELLRQLRQAAQTRGGNEDEATYVWNTNWLNKVGCVSASYQRDLVKLPDKILTFTAPDADIYPTFRLPPDYTIGTNSINRFGFRGPDIDLKKPPRTIRIAIAGSSTVMDSYFSLFSYPELAVNWLNVWAARTGHNVKFEVINGGRSGVSPLTIEKIITREILPFRPDLVIFDATAQGRISSMVELEGKDDPEDTKRALAARRESALGHGREITDWSAVARRIYFAMHGKSIDDAELPKPKQSLAWPPGVSEQDPDLDASDLPMSLPETIAALDRIHRAVSEANGELAISSAVWLTNPALKLDVIRNWSVYQSVNLDNYPATLSSLDRAVKFQNKVFAAYSQRRGIQYLDTQAEMPVDANLFGDITHTWPSGSRIKAWILFNQLLPLVVAKLVSGEWPRSAVPGTVDEDAAFPQPTLSNNPCLQTYIPTGATPVFSLVTDGSAVNYKPGTAATRFQAEADGLLVTSDQSKYFYQLVSDQIHVDPGKTYVIVYEYELLKGQMDIGILSKREDRFLLLNAILPRDPQQGPKTYAWFQTSEDIVKLVVSNDNEPSAVSRIKLRKVEIYEAAPAPGRAER
jgi:hypothetical protein